MTVIFLLTIFVFLAIRAKATLTVDLFNPISVWYVFLIVFIWQRLLVIAIFDANYRHFSSFSRSEIEYSIFIVANLSLAATFAFELAFRKKVRVLERNPARLRFSLGIIVTVFLAGLIALFSYFQLLGGVNRLLSTIAESKGVSGGGPLFALASLSILGPLLALESYAKTRNRIMLVLALFMLLVWSVGYGLYGRAGNVVWAWFIFVLFYHYRVRFLLLKEFMIALPTIFLLLTVFKTFRITMSWQADVNSLADYYEFFATNFYELYILRGGEFVVVDTSILAVLMREKYLPLGTFSLSWVKWIIDLIPSAIFQFSIEEPSVGRQMARYFYGLGHYSSGLPVMGHIVAMITGTLALTVIVYGMFGAVARGLYARIFSGSTAALFLHGTMLWFLLSFTRVGDFTAAIIAMTVLTAVPITILFAMERMVARSRKTELPGL